MALAALESNLRGGLYAISSATTAHVHCPQSGRHWACNDCFDQHLCREKQQSTNERILEAACFVVLSYHNGHAGRLVCSRHWAKRRRTRSEAAHQHKTGRPADACKKRRTFIFCSSICHDRGLCLRWADICTSFQRKCSLQCCSIHAAASQRMRDFIAGLARLTAELESLLLSSDHVLRHCASICDHHSS
jgi:hypothetical protein